MGIFLFFLGGTLFLGIGYGFINKLTMGKQEMIEKVKTELAVKGVENYFSDEQIEKMLDDNMKFGKTISPIIMLLGVGIALGGFILYKRGVKDAQLSDTVKFE